MQYIASIAGTFITLLNEIPKTVQDVLGQWYGIGVIALLLSFVVIAMVQSSRQNISQ